MTLKRTGDVLGEVFCRGKFMIVRARDGSVASESGGVEDGSIRRNASQISRCPSTDVDITPPVPKSMGCCGELSNFNYFEKKFN